MKKKTSPTKSSSSVQENRFLYPALLILATLWVWWPVTSLEFVNWDDVTYLTSNSAVQSFNLSALFQEYYAGNYHPLTMLSLALEHKLAGLNPASFHRTNLFLHCLNGVLVFFLFKSLSLSSIQAFILSLIFSLHPLRVESVAWVAERKDVLYASFWLASALAWFTYRKTQSLLWFSLALLAFILSCLSKAMAVTLLPFLVFIEWFSQKKFDFKHFVPFIPMALIGLATGVLALFAQGSALGLQGNYSLLERVVLVNYGFWFYPIKTLIPIPLSAFYPYPEQIPVFWYLLVALSIALIWVLYRYANQRVLLGVLLYGVVLLPVAQVVPVGQALVADRYSYLPFIGLLLLLSALLQEILRKFSLRENQLLLAMIPLCIVLAWACRDRIQVWQNSITLYQDVLLQYPSYSTGYVNYGNALRDKGDWQKAEQAYWLGVYSDPKNDLPWNNLGILASFRKQPERAVYFYSRAAELKPGFPINQYNIATVWFNQGKPAQALPAVEEALKIDPNYGEALHLRGVLLQQLQRYDESIASLLQAMKQKPEEIQILNDLGTTYFYAQKIGEAEAAFQKSIALDPSNNPNAYNNIGFVLFNSGRQEEAIEMYRKAAAQGHPEAAAYLRQLGR